MTMKLQLLQMARHESLTRPGNKLAKLLYTESSSGRFLSYWASTRFPVRSRSFSSRSRFKLDALPFSISPEQALAKFEHWANEDQGLRHLLSWSSVRIAAAYVPVWSFDVNLRFKVQASYQWKPSFLEAAYPNQTTIFVSGMSVYSGHSYRRSLINPVHNTTLVFIGDQVQPFGDWMLREMDLSNGHRLEIFPDPWNATKSQAVGVLRQELTSIAQGERRDAELKMQVVSSKRVYMPTFVIEYSILGMDYQAFVSGCDDGVGVSGVNHQLWGGSTASLPSSASFLEGVSTATQLGVRVLGSRGIATVLALIFQVAYSIAARLLIRLPAIAFFGSIFVGFKKILYPWMGHRYASAEWERQREREASGSDHAPPIDDFDDLNGSARRYFQKNKNRILRDLSGESDHHRGDYDWYKDWEEWARRQYEQQSRQQSYYEQQQEYSRQQQQQARQQQQQQQRRTTAKPEFQWDFDPNDPYSVLGIRRGASTSDVSAAFRREMLKHHPDMQAGKSEAEKERSQERSKYITEAYRKIKNERK
jgi:hypothetical protein